MNKEYKTALEYIDGIKTTSIVKKSLYNFNNIYYNLKKYDIDLFKYNILVDNIDKFSQKMLLEYLIKILNIYGIEIEERNFGSRITAIKTYLYIDDSFDFSNFERLTMYPFKYDLIICMYQDKIENVDNYFTQKLYDKNKYVRITLESGTQEEALDELKKLYKNNKIKYNLTDEELNKLYECCVDSNVCVENSFVATIFGDSIKYLVEKNKGTIDKCFLKEYIKKDEKVIKEAVQLDNLVGLSNIKNEIKILKKYVKYCNENNIDVNKRYLNMFFIGGPGTGKTTMARVLTNIFFELGFIRENKLIETTPSNMQGSYVGHTKDKVNKILTKAKNGVLFIDEAYYFSRAQKDKGGAFLLEALELLLKYMEDPSHIVIFSGYEREMNELYNLNSGFKSRIYKEIKFDNFSDEELYTILENKLNENNLIIQDINVKMRVMNLLSKAKNKNDFGNARYCEVLAQTIFMNHINNDDITNIINEVDIPDYNEKNINYVMGLNYE